MSESRSWVETPRATVGEVLSRYVKHLKAKWHDRRIERWEVYAAIWQESLSVSLQPSRARALNSGGENRSTALTYNITRSIIDTGVSRLVQQRPRPDFVTDGGDWDRQEQARELQLLVDGVFADQKAYSTGAEAVIDCAVFGTGVLKTVEVSNRPNIERTLISEIVVDEDACQFTPPREMHQYRELPRGAMMKLYPRFAQRLAELSGVKMLDSGAVSDMVTVIESWSLPLDLKNPGRHVIVVDGIPEALIDEDWTRPTFPFAFIFWQKPRTGFYGIGLAAQLFSIQIETNKFLRNISKSFTNMGVPRVFMPNSMKINPLHITNNPAGTLIPMEGMGTPTIWSQQILSPEVVQWLEMQIRKSYEFTGISQNTAFAVREPGVTSAKGHREVSMRQNDRLSLVSQAVEQMYLDTAQNVVDVCRDIMKRPGAQLTVSSVDDGSLHTVDVPEALKLQPGDYTLGLFAGNLLSKHPAGRFEDIQTMSQMGALEKSEIRKLMDMPDLRAVTQIDRDPETIYQKQIRNLLRRGVYIEPESFHPLEVGLPLYQRALFEAQTSGVKTERLDQLRQWIEAAIEIMTPPPTVPESAPAQDVPAPQDQPMPQG